MEDSNSEYNQKLGDSPGLEITGKIMVTVMMILFFTVVLVLFLHLYLKCFTYHSQRDMLSTSPRRRRRQSRRFHFVAGHPASGGNRHLDPLVLNSIPVIIYSKEKNQEMECAVCLSETVDGEKIRILPKCNHGFHMDCIDMWFQSNSTCPICRNTVSNQHETKPDTQNSEPFPTNVLVWGNQNEVTSSSSTSEEPSSSSSSSSVKPVELVIDIPRQIEEDEETKSPMIRRLKSLKRLLSMGGTRVSPSSSADPGKMGPEQC